MSVDAGRCDIWLSNPGMLSEIVYDGQILHELLRDDERGQSL